MYNILIVEDDEVLNHGIQYCLKDDYMNMDSVYSFKQAEKIIEKESYDLIILDISLPDGNGFELCEKIRKVN